MRIRLLAGCILAAGALAACGSPAPTAEPVASAAPATVVTDTGAAAEGRLQPRQTATLSFNTGGRVAEVLVAEGETVQAGQVLARLDHDGLQAALAEAEAALVVIQANQANYQSALALQIAATEAEIKAAQSQGAGAAASRNTSAAITDAQSRLAQLRYQLQQLITTRDQLYLYEKERSSAAEDVRQQIAATQQSIKATEAQIAALRSGSPADQAAEAQMTAAAASEAAAQAKLAQLQAEASGKATDTFAAQIQQAQAAISAAQVSLTQAELIAPFAGTVARLNLKAGEHATAGVPAVTLADVSGWLIETSDVTEIKVPEIQVGQTVTIRVDALPDVELTGQVESIGAVSRLLSGDVVYPVKITVTEADPRLRWGMTVAVAFEK